MKIRLLLFLVFLSIGAVKAQAEFAPLGATWYYGNRESMFGDMGFTKTTVADTAVIDGKKVKVLISEYHGSSGSVSPRDTVYAYQTGDSVLFYLDGDFHLVYNFSLNVGDTMELYNPDNKYCGDEWLYEHIVVESIKTLNINGNQLKEFKLTPVDSYSKRYQYIEKIGTTSSLFGENCIYDNFGGGLFGWLRCYSDSEIGNYQYDKEACDSIYKFDMEAYHRWEDSMSRVDVADKEDLELRLFYSQSDKVIVIDTYDSCEPSVVKVFDVDGRMMFSDVCEPNNQTRVALKKKGIYIVLVNNNIGTYHEKIIAY